MNRWEQSGVFEKENLLSSLLASSAKQFDISLFYRYDLSREYMGELRMKKATTPVNWQQQSGAF